MTVANINKELVSLRDRLRNVETELREAKEVAKNARDGILQEAKSKGYPLDGLKGNVKDLMLTDKQVAKAQRIEEEKRYVAERLGEFADTGLGGAAIERSAARLRAV